MIAPDDIRTELHGHNVIVFDGVCVFCNAWIDFVLRRDRDRQFSFVIAQSGLGERIYDRLGLKSDDYDTFIVITRDGQVATSLDGVFTVFRRLGPPWSALSVLGVMPRGLKDFIYTRVARNRYRIFGRREICRIPGPEIRARFLGGVD